MSIDWTKPIETRDGRKAEYIMRISNDEYPRVVKVTHEDGHEAVYGYTEAGGYFAEPIMDNMDLRNQKVITHTFQRIYDNTGMRRAFGTPYPTLEDLNTRFSVKALGVLKMTFEDGIPVKAELV